ncbi:5-methyltetrahydropteroyltriglutamate-homocysteine methyltransferase [Apiospora arundinis]
MFSSSLANRTKLVPFVEGNRSHELSIEAICTSQADPAFDASPDTDACQFALSPESIQEEKEEPTQPGAMVGKKSNSSGDLRIPPPPEARKKKIRHKKCDEEKSTCRRCAAANVVCDGYPSGPQTSKSKEEGGSVLVQAVAKSAGSSSPSNSSRGGPSRRKTPLLRINTVVFESATEARYFHHFRACTRFGLADSAGLVDFWDAYALPIAHQEDYLRQTIAAVGAAHQLFVIRSYTASDLTTWDTEQENAAIRQYNRAISSLVRAMSSQNPVASSHGALLCCLMFVTFESMLGRYSEAIKHIKSGFQLIASMDAAGKVGDVGLWQQVYDMFARLGLEFSVFMDAPLTPALPSNTPVAMVSKARQPFHGLNEALYALRTLDIGHFIALHEAEQQHLIRTSRPPMPEDKIVRADPYAQELPRGISRSPVPCSATTTTFRPLWEEHWNGRFYAWKRRFELTVKRLPPAEDLPESDRSMLARLRLQQSFWEIAVELSKNGGNAAGVSSETCEECLQRAESLAAPFLAQNKPTFSIDGDLISDLSFIISVCRDPSQRERAMRLLRSLNRREGIWDSREIAEMHEFSISLGVAELWGGDEELGCSVPAFMRSLARISQQVYTPRASLVSMADFRGTSSSSTATSIPDCEETYAV